MSLATLFVGACGVGVGCATSDPAVLIFAFWLVLLGVSLSVVRDHKVNHDITGTPIRPEAASPYWDTLDDLYAWPTAAPNTYPDEEAA